MKYRILRARVLGAYRVLRGEYVAQPRVQVIQWPLSTTTTSTNSAIYFDHTP